MTSIAGSLNRSSTGWIAWAGMAAVIVAAIVIPNLQRSRMAANHSYEAGLPTAVRYQSAGQDEIRLNEPVLVSAALIEPAAKAGAATDRERIDEVLAHRRDRRAIDERHGLDRGRDRQGQGR